MLAGLPNVEIRIYKMKGIPRGAGVLLPEYVKRSKSIIGLTHKTYNYAYNDNLCLFRCLALHFGTSMHSREREAARLKENLERHTGKSYEEGVEVGMLADVEIYFNMSSTYTPSRKHDSVNFLQFSKIVKLQLLILVNTCKSFAGRRECEKWTLFSSEDKNSTTIFEGQPITFSQWDKRTPGMFKPE